MKVSDIIRRVRNIAGDTAVLQFTDDMCMDWINDALRDIYKDNLDLAQKTGSVSTVVGVGTITLPSDIMKLHSVTYEGIKLQGFTMQQFENDFKQGDDGESTPRVYYVWGGVLNLYPIPSAVGALRINYSRTPAEVTAVADVPDAPESYHSRLVDFCLAQVAQQDGDNNLYQIKMQEFATGVSSLKDHPEYDNDLYPFISVSDRDSGLDSTAVGWFYGG